MTLQLVELEKNWISYILEEKLHFDLFLKSF